MFDTRTRLFFFACLKDAVGASLKSAAPAPGSDQQKNWLQLRNTAILYHSCLMAAAVLTLLSHGCCSYSPVSWLLLFLLPCLMAAVLTVLSCLMAAVLTLLSHVLHFFLMANLVILLSRLSFLSGHVYNCTNKTLNLLSKNTYNAF